MIFKKIFVFLAIVAVLAAVVGGLSACTSPKATSTSVPPTVTPIIVPPTATPTSEGVVPLPAQKRLKVATTTSLYDTGLWGYLEPMFEKKYGAELDVLYAGTGKALEWGRRGDVDAIAVHDKAEEEKFVAEGYGIKRVPFAYNHFVIVGPESDPAGIRGMSPEDAFKKLMEKGQSDPQAVKFVSRGDNSGTHSKEKEIWNSIGYDYDKQVRKSGTWYIEAGSGMGPTLVMASEKSAYTLSDIGTFLAFKGKLNLVPVVEKGAILLNVYSVIAVNPGKTPGTNVEMANRIVDFLISVEIQELIGNYGLQQYGRQLFTPCAGAEPSS